MTIDLNLKSVGFRHSDPQKLSFNFYSSVQCINALFFVINSLEFAIAICCGTCYTDTPKHAINALEYLYYGFSSGASNTYTP